MVNSLTSIALLKLGSIIYSIVNNIKINNMHVFTSHLNVLPTCTSCFIDWQSRQ